jgi:hypothetical protein
LFVREVACKRVALARSVAEIVAIMANLLAIHSVGESLRAHLDASYPSNLRTAYPCTFVLAASADIANSTASSTAPEDPASTQLTLFLYSVTIGNDARSSVTNSLPGQTPVGLRNAQALVVDLHYLVSATSRSAAAEQIVLAYTMRQLATHPTFDATSLTSDADWKSGDAIQLTPESLSTNDLSNLWTALGHGYRVSGAYVARGVRIDVEPTTPSTPVLTRRITSNPGSTPA